MITRRTVLRGMSLAGLAVGGGAWLSACGSDSGGPRSRASEPVKAGGIDLVSSDAKREAGEVAAIPDAVRSMHTLAAGLYGELSATQGNLALSPYSVAVALAMTQNGARGATRDEMLSVLASDDGDRLNAGLNALTQHVGSLAGVQKRADRTEAEIALSPANTLFGEATTEFEPEFIDTLASDYGAGLHRVDFKTGFEGARVAINDWTAERTEDRINDLIPEDVLNTLTRLVLVNALYFKAPWESTFERTLTDDREFHLTDGSAVSVPTMFMETRMGLLGSGDGWQALQLPYAGRKLAMTIVLPDVDRLAEVEAELAAGGLPEMVGSVEPAEVAITLPKWTFRTEAPLNDTLTALGMPMAFDEGQADFSGMTSQERLFIAAVLHQAFIAVDEEGTEAAAATAVVAQTESMPMYVPYTVDRPFLFVIHDVEHGTPLFVGRVADPRADAG